MNKTKPILKKQCPRCGKQTLLESLLKCSLCGYSKGKNDIHKT